MTTIGFARPPLLGEEAALPDHGPRDPMASASAAVGVLAVAAVMVEQLRIVGIPACALAAVLALASWRRSRVHSRPPRITAWAGLFMAAVAGVGLVGTPAAFGSVSEAGSTPPAAAPAPAAADSDSTLSTTDVLTRDITVSFGSPYTQLDNTVLVMATVPVSVRNITDHAASYNLQFAARDATGRVITTDSAFVPNVAAGQTAQIRVFNIVNSTLVPRLMSAHYSVTQAAVD
jgi:hypothetical protein